MFVFDYGLVGVGGIDAVPSPLSLYMAQRNYVGCEVFSVVCLIKWCWKVGKKAGMSEEDVGPNASQR